MAASSFWDSLLADLVKATSIPDSSFYVKVPTSVSSNTGSTSSPIGETLTGLNALLGRNAPQLPAGALVTSPPKTGSSTAPITPPKKPSTSAVALKSSRKGKGRTKQPAPLPVVDSSRLGTSEVPFDYFPTSEVPFEPASVAAPPAPSSRSSARPPWWTPNMEEDAHPGRPESLVARQGQALAEYLGVRKPSVQELVVRARAGNPRSLKRLSKLIQATGPESGGFIEQAILDVVPDMLTGRRILRQEDLGDVAVEKGRADTSVVNATRRNLDALSAKSAQEAAALSQQIGEQDLAARERRTFQDWLRSQPVPSSAQDYGNLIAQAGLMTGAPEAAAASINPRLAAISPFAGVYGAEQSAAAAGAQVALAREQANREERGRLMGAWGELLPFLGGTGTSPEMLYRSLTEATTGTPPAGRPSLGPQVFSSLSPVVKARQIAGMQMQLQELAQKSQDATRTAVYSAVARMLNSGAPSDEVLNIAQTLLLQAMGTDGLAAVAAGNQ